MLIKQMNELEFRKRLEKIINETFDVWTLTILRIIKEIKKILKSD